MKSTEPRIERIIEKYVHMNDRILLAVSGGKDSVTMLHAISNISKYKNTHIGVCHVDHGLRKTSEEHAIFVKQLAESYGVPFYLAKLKAEEKRGNTEAWARISRYHALSVFRKEQGYRCVFTAHTADDVVETLLMKMVSNKELTSLHQIDDARFLVRPMLRIWSKEVHEYISSACLKFVADETNEDTTFLRNKIRHKLISFIEDTFGSNAIKALLSVSERAHDDVTLLRALSQYDTPGSKKFEFGTKEWVRTLRKRGSELPDALRWRLVESAFEAKLGYKLGPKHSIRLSEVVFGSRPRIQVPGYEILRSEGGLIVKAVL